MNIKFGTLATMLAASLAFVSCSRDNVFENSITQPATGETRVIAVSFQNNSTKTGLDGFLPKFVNGDVIKVSNVTAVEDCIVRVKDDGKATIATTLTGTLTAVYPASAARMNNNAIDGILVPTVQDGTFARANISKTTIEEGATEAKFANQTAVFKITPGAGADTKYVEVITDGAEIANYDPEGNYPSLHKIHVASTSADPVYVSILVPSGLKISNLGFADGSNIKGLKDDATAISVSTLYTVTSENWDRPYVEIAGRKWATMNIGATKAVGLPAECFGDYFAWGATEPYYTSISFTYPKEATINGWKSGKDKGYNGDSYTEWDPAPYDATSKNLISSHDAATANWGSSWRMPTHEDIISLWEACLGINTGRGGDMEPDWDPESIESGGLFFLSAGQVSLPDYTGVAGCLFVCHDNPNKRVFFPCAGEIRNKKLDNTAEFKCGSSWTSTLYIDYDEDEAYYLQYGYSGTNTNEPELRCYGKTVRAVSE